MLKDIICNFFNSYKQLDETTLNLLIDDNCLFINYDNKAYLSKIKVIDALIEIHKNYKIKQLNLLNTVKDAEDTMLVAYSVFIESANIIFGTSIIRVKNDKIVHIKNFIVN